MTNRKPDAQHGGARKGAGRPRGRRNDTTVKREREANETLAKFFSEIDVEHKEFSPLETLLLVMHIHLRGGNLSGAANAARDAAPYVHSRVEAIKPDFVIPADLKPDPTPIPDEAGPANPIN